MKKNISKTQVQEQIKEFFLDIQDKTPKEIKKIKRLAANYKIPLKQNRKKFCKKCFNAYKNPKIRIKNNIKSVTCRNCNNISRWKINFS